jgi:hypothetical protein
MFEIGKITSNIISLLWWTFKLGTKRDSWSHGGFFLFIRLGDGRNFILKTNRVIHESKRLQRQNTSELPFGCIQNVHFSWLCLLCVVIVCKGLIQHTKSIVFAYPILLILELLLNKTNTFIIYICFFLSTALMEMSLWSKSINR